MEITDDSMGKNPPILSKSRFLAGLQCPLRLWYQCYNRELAVPVSPMQQALFDSGNEIGRIATERYPSGILIEADHLHHEEAVQSTLDAMNDSQVGAIFEAAFLENGIRVRVDILERVSENRWNLIEVKSSTGVKEEHRTDVAVQYHVLQAAGLGIDRVYLMHINREYVFDGGDLDLGEFLMLEDLTNDAVELQRFVLENLSALKHMLSADIQPIVQPSRRCHQPHTCEFWEHCIRDAPENWIFELSGIRQEQFADLTTKGVVTIDNIPKFYPLTAIQQRIRDCVIESREYIDPSLRDVLTNIRFPIHFIDFETIMPAIPGYAGTRPYQTIPFQWSDHTQYLDGKMEHSEFLCEDNIDPREGFTKTLLEVLGEEGTIFIYTTYEKRIIGDLAEHFPKYAAQLNRLHGRFVDLCALLKTYYYNPVFRGSFSLKYVLPALVPEMSYQDLVIQEGGMASLEYQRMIDTKTPDAEKKEIRKNLIAYCSRDTLAMLRIREVLMDKLKK